MCMCEVRADGVGLGRRAMGGKRRSKEKLGRGSRLGKGEPAREDGDK